MTHRQMNWTLAIVAALTLVAGTAMTPDDFATEAQKEQRAWMHAVQHCHRAYGPQTQPEYDERDHLICVGARGQRYQVATK